MWASSFSAILLSTLALSSSVCEARRLSRRACTITWPAIDGDTCASMARDWALDVDYFRAMNPTADCSKLVHGQEYCVDWEGTKPTAPAITTTVPPTVPSSTTLVTKTSSAPPTGPTGPSPVQEGITANCKLLANQIDCSSNVEPHRPAILSRQRRRYVPEDCRLIQDLQPAAIVSLVITT
jgi:hypothetical protein